MGHRGVHFALSEAERDRLAFVQASDVAVRAVVGELEARWDGEWIFETDKAWNALHRCFSDGYLTYEGKGGVLRLTIIGGTQVYSAEGYTVAALDDSEVKKVALALPKVTRAWLRKRYDRIDASDYADKSDKDFEYTWESFLGLPEFFAKAAAARRDVIFTVDC